MSHRTSFYWENEINIYSSEKQRYFDRIWEKIGAQDLTAGILTTIIVTETQRVHKKNPYRPFICVHTYICFHISILRYEDSHAFTFSYERDAADLRIKDLKARELS